jgi:hypothetical protein
MCTFVGDNESGLLATTSRFFRTFSSIVHFSDGYFGRFQLGRFISIRLLVSGLRHKLQLCLFT